MRSLFFNPVNTRELISICSSDEYKSIKRGVAGRRALQAWTGCNNLHMYELALMNNATHVCLELAPSVSATILINSHIPGEKAPV